MAATAVATVTAPQVKTLGEDHRLTFPIKVLAFDRGVGRGHDRALVASQHLHLVGLSFAAPPQHIAERLRLSGWTYFINPEPRLCLGSFHVKVLSPCSRRQSLLRFESPRRKARGFPLCAAAQPLHSSLYQLARVQRRHREPHLNRKLIPPLPTTPGARKPFSKYFALKRLSAPPKSVITTSSDSRRS